MDDGVRASGQLPRGYSRELAGTAEGTYWHLYCGRTRVNGGLAAYRDTAESDAHRYAWCHYYFQDDHRRVALDQAEQYVRQREEYLAGPALQPRQAWEWD